MRACRVSLPSAAGHREKGAVAVEFALVLPILSMFLFGIITFGLAYSDHLALTNTVREAARFGASTDNTAAWGNAVLTRTKSLYFNANSPLNDSQVCALLIRRTGGVDTVKQFSAAGCKAGTTSAGSPPPTPSDITDGTCFVKVWAARPADLNWVVVNTQVTLRADSVSLYGRALACQ